MSLIIICSAHFNRTINPFHFLTKSIVCPSVCHAPLFTIIVFLYLPVFHPHVFLLFLFFPPLTLVRVTPLSSFFFFFHLFLSSSFGFIFLPLLQISLCLPADCQFEIGGWDGIIRSSQVEEEERVKPGDALDCIWTIRAPPKSKVSIKNCISQALVMMLDIASLLLRPMIFFLMSQKKQKNSYQKESSQCF